jgi:type IV pilus modification protein PilV
MDTFIAKRIGRKRQSGMSLIELMIAMTVLVVGMLALMTLVTTAMSSNNRSRLDTTGTMLAQTVLEGIAAQPATSNQPFTMNDCNPAGSTAWTIATAGPAAIGNSLGADVVASTGNIDFNTQSYAAVPANYKMKYVTCGVSSAQATYDVRWNVRALTAFTKLITVSARQLGDTGANLPFFSPPITLRTIAGQ